MIRNRQAKMSACTIAFLLTMSILQWTPDPQVVADQPPRQCHEPALYYWPAIAVASSSKDVGADVDATMAVELLERGNRCERPINWGTPETFPADGSVHLTLVPRMVDQIAGYAKRAAEDGEHEKADGALTALVHFLERYASSQGNTSLSTAAYMLHTNIRPLLEREPQRFPLARAAWQHVTSPPVVERLLDETIVKDIARLNIDYRVPDQQREVTSLTEWLQSIAAFKDTRERLRNIDLKLPPGELPSRVVGELRVAIKTWDLASGQSGSGE